MVDCINTWTRSLDSRKPVDVVYIDFQKAFDSVVHEKLLIKLGTFGFRPQLLVWLRNFLTDRSQRIKIKSVYSDSSPVLSGVPQGSILGPTLFLLYINDLVDVIQFSEIRLFADDLKIYNLSANHKFLQSDLDNLCSWAKSWQLSLSYSKCNILHLGRSNPIHVYRLDNYELIKSNGCKDLGIFVNENLSFSIHCNNIVAKSSKISNLIHRTFTSKNPELLVKAFNSYVRPILEYSSPVWNPHLIKDINNIENVQRRFTKRFAPKGLSYNQRLEFLKMERLEVRRIKLDAILAFNIIRNNLLPSHDFFTIPHGITRSCSISKLCVANSRLNSTKYNFSNRCIKIWNFLPFELRNSNTVDIFRKKLDKIDFCSFIRGRA